MKQIVVLLPSFSKKIEKDVALTRLREAFHDIKEEQIIFLCDIWEGDTEPRPENVIKYKDMKSLDIFNNQNSGGFSYLDVTDPENAIIRKNTDDLDTPNNQNQKKHCYLDVTKVENRELDINAMWIAIGNLKALSYNITIFKHWHTGDEKIKILLEM